MEKMSAVSTPEPSKRRRDERLLLSDMSVLECPICFHPLTVPVFQCANGHLSCSTCHKLLKRKCPTCSKQLGNLRNLAMESVIESIKVSCPYKIHGCAEKIILCNIRSHEKECGYAPYKCPFSAGCAFSASPRKLYDHLKKQHTSSVALLSLGRFSRVPPALDFDSAVFLETRDDGAIFILNTKTMGLTCIHQDPKPFKAHGFAYTLQASIERPSFKCSLEVHSVTCPFRASDVDCPPLHDFVQALKYILVHDELVSLRLKVQTMDSSSTGTTSGVPLMLDP